MSKLLSNTITLAWVHGCAAFHAARATTACPYQRDSQERRDWLKGWNFARDRAYAKTKSA